MSAHLFADISSHGLGHLAQAAPVLNALHALRPAVRLTIRSGLPRERLALRIAGDFAHVHEASDFGFVMHDAIDIDLPASAARYREFHTDWPGRVQREAGFLAALAPDLVFSDVAYLPLAGAVAAGIPAVALCSLNWADLVHHYFRQEPWLPQMHQQILSAYRGARAFLRTTPGMPMLDLPNVIAVGPLAAHANLDRAEVARQLGLPTSRRWVLVALGGFEFPLPMEQWPQHRDILWLKPETFGNSGVRFNDLLANVDAVLTKPGYGTFIEATVHGVPVLYLRRPDWPEQSCLIDWLHQHNRAAEITLNQARHGDLSPTLEALWALPAPDKPKPSGSAQAARTLLDLLPC
jgi:hypothetical protein